MTKLANRPQSSYLLRRSLTSWLPTDWVLRSVTFFKEIKLLFHSQGQLLFIFSIFFLLSALLTRAHAAPLPSPREISVPDSTFNHDNPRILCTSMSWASIAVFYLGNYVAHAATIYTYPGEGSFSTIRSIFIALLFPAAGVARGLNGIFRHASLCQESQLRVAARAGALCMVVRSSDWKEQNATTKGTSSQANNTGGTSKLYTSKT
jgi:hypothetical protein